MKKLVRSVLMLSIASIAILSSCSKTDDNADVTDVKVEITSTPASPVLINSIVTLTITATGNVDNKVKSISVTRDGKTLLSKSLSGTSARDTIVDTIGAEASYIYTVAVTGEKGSPATKIYTLTTKQPAGHVDISPTPIPLFSQLFTSGGAHFMKLTDPFTTFGTNEHAANKSNIDVVYYYGGSKHTLTSPSDAPMQAQIYSTNYDWTGAKNTLLYKTSMTAAQFDEYEQGSSDEALVAMGKSINTWTSSVKELKAADVLIYKTAAGKYGYIKVNSVSGTNSSDSQIELKFAVQQ